MATTAQDTTTDAEKRDWAMREPAVFPGSDSVPQLIREICEPEATRFSLAQPWIADGFVYATDCRIIARCSAEMVSPEAADYLNGTMVGRRVPTAADLFIPSKRGKAVKLPTVKDPCAPCGYCEGDGHDDIDLCPLCGGDGDHKGATAQSAAAKARLVTCAFTVMAMERAGRTKACP